MKAYKREDFIKLPEGTIYSRIDENSGELLTGLFCKESGPENSIDWYEQNLISEIGFPNDISSGDEAYIYQFNLRDTYQDFETDLDCCGRDGMFDDSDRFVVWDKDDVTELRDYLSEVLLKNPNYL